MATYIQGLTDFIPEIQQFTPDYNMLGNVLQAKESQYQAGRKQLSDAYGKILYSPMTREDNIKKRDEFLKAVDQDIKKMAGLDLSLPQNQQAAMQVFNGFYDDKLMVKDMMWTKNLQNQQMKGQLLKSCVDPEKCGGQWWEGGDKELMYKQDEFRKMSADEAMKFDNVEYTPFHNVEDLANKYAKAQGYSMKLDSKSGGWIITNKNGQIMEPHLAEAFLSKFGNEPAVRKMYKTQGYLNRKDWVANNMHLHNNDEAATTQAYISNMMAMSEKAQETKKQVDKKVEKVTNDKKLIEKQVTESGYYKGVDGKLKSLYDGITESTEILQGAQAVAKTETDNYAAAKANPANLRYSAERIDEIVGINLLRGAVSKAAHNYSTLTAESEMKVDPIYLTTLNHNLSLRNSLTVADAQHKYNLLEKEAAFKYDVALKQIEQGIIPGQEGTDAGLTADPNITGTGENKGTIIPKDENYRALYAAEDKINGTKVTYLQQFTNSIVNGYKAASTEEQKTFYRNALSNSLKGTGISVDKVLASNLTPADVVALSKLNSAQLNNAFTMAKDYANPLSQNGAPAKNFFSGSFNKATAPSIAALGAEEKALQALQDKMKGVATDAANQAIANLRQKGGDNALKADILSTYLSLSPNARPFSAQEVMVDYKTGNGAFRKIQKVYEDKNWKSFITQVNPYLNEKTATPQDIQKAKVLAGAFYDKNVLSAMQEFDNTYNKTAISYRQAPGLPGQKANAVTSMGYSGYADSDAKGESFNALADWANTYRNLSNDPSVKVAFGDAGTMAQGIDPAAKKMMDFMLFQMNTAHKKGDANRFRANWHMQMVAGNDANYVSFTVKPDAAYLSQFEGTETKPGPLYGITGAAENGITVFLPKSKVDNKTTAMLEADPIDYAYNATNEVELASNYMKARITRNDVTGLPMIEFTGKEVDAKGNLVDIAPQYKYFTESEFGSGAKDLKASALIKQFLPQLFVYDDDLEASIQKVRNALGTKDPNALTSK